ncbi:hypothetical protein [Desulfoluna sp.]|uniref:hypothetical protein n=1 Tax=Desulfoluna sp. TaxID=2045199 RepID=UPI0026061E31|nr:hypothetical protein [Desulfoluna sp.]
MKKLDTKKPEDVTPIKSPKKVLRLLAVGLLVAALTAGGWFAYTTFFRSDYPRADLSFVDLDDAVLRFTWREIPDVYGQIIQANAELVLMEGEIDRITQVGKKYPRQKKIVTSEINRWKKSVQKLTSQLHRFQNQVEALYVTFRVNPEKGRTAIQEKASDLATSMKDTLADVKTQTVPLKNARIAPKGIKGIIISLKERFL